MQIQHRLYLRTRNQHNEDFHTEWDSIKFNGEYFIIKNFAVKNNNENYINVDEIKIKPLKLK